MKTDIDPLYLVKALNQCPPWLCRLMAISTGKGKPTKRFSTAQLAKSSGLSKRSVARISYSDDFSKCSLETVSRFTAACGVNLLEIKKPMSRFFRMHSSGRCDYLTKLQKEALERLKKDARNG